MKWTRDLLFIGLVIGGTSALAYNLIPARVPKSATSYDAPSYRETAFRDTVTRVDDSFRRQWSEASLSPAALAEDLQIARRVSLALMGTVPSLEEIRQLETLPTEQRLPWYLDHVLNDRRFNEYYAERMARAFVGTEDGPFVLFRRRRFVTWLEDQLAAQTPYDHIVRHLIDDTGLWTDKPSTNFVSVTCQKDLKNQPNPVRLAGRVTRAFLGLRLDCAECHNHPFAEWKQADFQGLSAFFGQTSVSLQGVQDEKKGEYQVEDKKSGEKKVIEPMVPFARGLLPDNGSRRERLAGWVTHPKNPYFARAAVNRVWALMFGRPIVEPVDNLQPDSPVPPALQILADDFAEHGFDLRRLIRLIASTQVFRLGSAAGDEAGEDHEKAWAAFPITRLRPEQVAGSVLQASTISTINADSHIFVRLFKFGQTNEFVKRYGDSGEDEFEGRGGTIPQRLLMMNGNLVRERIKADGLRATGLIAAMAPNDPKAIEVAYLAVLSRRPTDEEAKHFEASLADKSISRSQRIEDLFWALVNSTEFSWNH